MPYQRLDDGKASEGFSGKGTDALAIEHKKREAIRGGGARESVEIFYNLPPSPRKEVVF